MSNDKEGEHIMKFDYHIIVIGAGSGGLVVASGASSIGAKVALIEGNKMGGDCLNTGCVPSKSFLRSAHIAGLIKRSEDFGLQVVKNETDIGKVMSRVNSVIKEIEPHDSKERYEKLGVHVIEGYGQLEDRHTVVVANKKYTGKHIVIATGSTAFVPDIKGLDQVKYYTNEHIFNIKVLPKRLIVLGAGPIGCELGQGFSLLGSHVTMINRSKGLFKRDDPEVGPIMEKQFLADGMVLELGVSIKEVRKTEAGIEVDILKDGVVKTIEGDAILIALGRKPATQGLNLEAIGINTLKNGQIITNKKMQTNISNIYACGDVTGPYAFTHMAGKQASIVIQNTIFPVKSKADYRAVPWVTYTMPEVAHVGLTEPMAQQSGIEYKVYNVPLKDNDRAKAESDRVGFLKIIASKKGLVLGATMVGEKAGEQIGLANIAVVKRLKVSAFISMVYPYPTELEIYSSIGLLSLKESFKPWQKKLVKKLFLKE